MQLLTVIKLGHPLLRQKSHPIVNPQQPQIKELIKNLMATMAAADGVGIAAPQTSQSSRLFIVASRPNPRYPQAPLMVATPMINPQILAHGEEIVKDWEGCLSIPGLRGLVPRYQKIWVEYINQHGEIVQQQMEGFPARIFQHELDHLEGILFIDRIETEQDLFTEAEYQAMINPIKPGHDDGYDQR